MGVVCALSAPGIFAGERLNELLLAVSAHNSHFANPQDFQLGSWQGSPQYFAPTR